MTADERHEQRTKALAAANELRLYRAEVKRDIGIGATDPVLPLMEHDPKLETMRIEEYLLAIPKIGRSRIDILRRTVGIRPETQMGNLTDRQRDALVMWVGKHVERSASWRRNAAGLEEAVA